MSLQVVRLNINIKRIINKILKIKFQVKLANKNKLINRAEQIMNWERELNTFQKSLEYLFKLCFTTLL